MLTTSLVYYYWFLRLRLLLWRKALLHQAGLHQVPPFFPQVLSVLLFVLAIILAFQTPTDTDKRLNLNVVFIMIAFGVYVFLVEPIGFVVSTVIFTVGYLLLLGERRWYFIIPQLFFCR